MFLFLVVLVLVIVTPFIAIATGYNCIIHFLIVLVGGLVLVLTIRAAYKEDKVPVDVASPLRRDAYTHVSPLYYWFSPRLMGLVCAGVILGLAYFAPAFLRFESSFYPSGYYYPLPDPLSWNIWHVAAVLSVLAGIIYKARPRY